MYWLICLCVVYLLHMFVCGLCIGSCDCVWSIYWLICLCVVYLLAYMIVCDLYLPVLTILFSMHRVASLRFLSNIGGKATLNWLESLSKKLQAIQKQELLQRNLNKQYYRRAYVNSRFIAIKQSLVVAEGFLMVS